MEEIFQGRRDPVDRESAHFNKFTITGATITLENEDGYGDLFLMPIIEAARTFSFSFRILRREGIYTIYIGIASRCQIKNEKEIDWDYRVCYSAIGYKWPVGVKEGSGFKNGDEVETVVCLK